MRPIRTLLAVLVVAAALVLVPGPAFACSCAAGGLAAYVERADVVFSGEVTEIDGPTLLPLGDTRTYTFDVDATYAGEPGEDTQVRSEASGAACGLEGIEVGRRYVVFAHHDGSDGELAANLCGGTAPATPRLLERLAAVAGPPRPPSGPGATGSAGMPLDTEWLLLVGGIAVAGPLGWLLLRSRP